MGTPQRLPRRGHRAFTAVCYVVLFVLGAAEGVVGSFQYSRSPAPLVAIILAVVIFVTCLLGGLGMGSFAGGIVPAIGWFAASFVLSLPESNGSVIITATTAGKWYLYGGALGAAAGAGTAFVLWVTRQPRRR
jgi:hypothetical protein